MKTLGISNEGIRRIAQAINPDMDEGPEMLDMGQGVGMDEPNLSDSFVSDDDAAAELVLYIDNTGELYNQKKSIQQNLVRKLNKGTYDASMAPKLWMYLVDAGAKMYAREMGADDFPWHKMFPPATRQEAARQMAETFYAVWESDPENAIGS